MDAALSLEASGAFTTVVVVANDGKARPEELGNSNVKWLRPDRNLGFGAGCQFGADNLGASKYAFFNSDVSMSPTALERCLAALDRPNVGIVGPVLLAPDGTLQSGCGTVSRFTWKTTAMNDPRGSDAELVDCSWVTGAALFCRGEVVRDIGWDGSYFLIYEDTDLCLRANKKGWRVVVEPDAVGTHPGHTTMGRSLAQYYTPRNRIWMTRRLGPPRALPVLLAAQLAQVPKIAAGDLLRRRSSLAKKQCAGIRAGLGKMPHDREPRSDEPVPSNDRDAV